MNFDTQQKIDEARKNSAMDDLVDIELFRSALDDIEALRTIIKSKEIIIESKESSINRLVKSSMGHLEEIEKLRIKLHKLGGL